MANRFRLKRPISILLICFTIVTFANSQFKSDYLSFNKKNVGCSKTYSDSLKNVNDTILGKKNKKKSINPRSILFFSSAGLIVGFMVGYQIGNNKQTNSFVMMNYAINGAIIGTGVGLVLGLVVPQFIQEKDKKN
jgi:hypothetical protein